MNVPMRILTTALLAASAATAAGQSTLPPCPVPFAAHRWSNCFGTAMTNTGALYRGEWLNDRYHGRGSYTTRNSEQYAATSTRKEWSDAGRTWEHYLCRGISFLTASPSAPREWVSEQPLDHRRHPPIALEGLVFAYRLHVA